MHSHIVLNISYFFCTRYARSSLAKTSVQYNKIGLPLQDLIGHRTIRAKVVCRHGILQDLLEYSKITTPCSWKSIRDWVKKNDFTKSLPNPQSPWGWNYTGGPCEMNRESQYETNPVNDPSDAWKSFPYHKTSSKISSHPYVSTTMKYHGCNDQCLRVSNRCSSRKRSATRFFPTKSNNFAPRTSV